MAAKTGNTFTSGTMIDSVEIPNEILGFSKHGPPANIWHDDYLENKREDYQNCVVLLCTTTVDNYMHTHM